VSRLLAVYRAQFALSLIVWFQYRVGMFFWFLIRLVEPMIYISVWSSIANAHGGSLDGLTAGDFAAYYIVLMVSNQMTFLALINLWGERVRSGALSAYLLRPVSVVHRDLPNMLANKTITLALIIPGGLILAVLFHPVFSLRVLTILGFLLALIIAFLLRFVLETLVGMGAFWITRMDAVERLYSVILFFCSGRIAPLALLPEWIRFISDVLPFRWILAFPTELLLGHLSNDDVLKGFLAQSLWLMVLLMCLPLVWRSGVKRYTGVDG
jgi:ABC-2 type transport system permease protein